VKDNRPVNLDITTIKFPLAAITSILHRISGIALFFGVAVLLYLLQLSLESEAGFSRATELLDATLMKLLVWGVLAAVLYHLIAGIKHLITDLGVGESREGARTGAVVVLVCALVAFVIAGVWIW
jgi:succinate dehydrogenase / fumarate reductase cytochrome b subunit